MNYKVVQFNNPQEPDAIGKYYPAPVYEKTIELDDLVKEISHAASLTSSDVRAVIEEVIEMFRRYLIRGNKIRLDGIGTFKLSFKGVGEITAEAVVSTNIDISTVRITFVADAALKRQIKAEISFSKVTEKGGAGKGAAAASSEDV